MDKYPLSMMLLGFAIVVAQATVCFHLAKKKNRRPWLWAAIALPAAVYLQAYWVLAVLAFKDKLEK